MPNNMSKDELMDELEGEGVRYVLSEPALAQLKQIVEKWFSMEKYLKNGIVIKL
jgi:hypothetical protein